MATPSLTGQMAVVNATLLSHCQALRSLLIEREVLLTAVLSLPPNGSDDVAARRLTECDIRALQAADDVLATPVYGLGDLYEKLSTFILLETFYADSPTLAATLLHQVYTDVRSLTEACLDARGSKLPQDPDQDIEATEAPLPSIPSHAAD